MSWAEFGWCTLAAIGTTLAVLPFFYIARHASKEMDELSPHPPPSARRRPE